VRVMRSFCSALNIGRLSSLAPSGARDERLGATVGSYTMIADPPEAKRLYGCER